MCEQLAESLFWIFAVRALDILYANNEATPLSGPLLFVCVMRGPFADVALFNDVGLYYMKIKFGMTIQLFTCLNYVKFNIPFS